MYIHAHGHAYVQARTGLPTSPPGTTADDHARSSYLLTSQHPLLYGSVYCHENHH